MGDSLETNILKLRIVTTWICYLSFFRGVASFFAGFVVTLVPISVAFLILLMPPIVILLPAKYDSTHYILITILLWLGGVLTDYIWLKLIFLLIGTSFSFLALRHDLKYYNLATLKWLPFIFGIDLLLRSPNVGQDLFVHSNLISKFIALLIALVLIYLIYSNEIKIKTNPVNSEKGLNLTQLGFTFTFFMIIAIYLIELAGPGILVLNNLTNQPFAIILTSSTFFILAYFALKINNKLDYKHGIMSSITLGFSIYFYPWYGVSAVLWLLAIFSIQILLQLNLEWFKVINQSERSKYILFGHYAIIIVMFYGFLTESYLLMPTISILVGIIFLTIQPSPKQKLLNLRINFSGLKNKIIAICIILLFVTPFIPMNSRNNALESTDNIRVMTYNLHFGISGDGVDNGLGVINLIKDINPTIIAFQEVTFAASINGYKNMYSFLQSELLPLGFKYSYFSEGGKYQTRNVIFSKLLMSESKTTLLSPRVVYERNVIETRVKIDNIELMIYATHLTHVIEYQSNPDRVIQAIQLMNIINSDSKSPVILLGDFNSEPDWEEIDVITSKLNDTWVENNGILDGFTWPNTDPRQRIDYIFHNSYATAESCSVMDSSASDHLPVVCDFQF